MKDEEIRALREEVKTLKAQKKELARRLNGLFRR